MKKKLSCFVLLTIWMISISFFANAQSVQDSIKSHIETMDGNEFIGTIVRETPETIILKTEKFGEITIRRTEIKKTTQFSSGKAKDGTYWLENPQSTRYFFAPNAYSLNKNEGYYQNVWVFFNQVVYGFTDHLSGGVGTVPLFLFGGGSTPAWVTMKYSVPVVKNKFNVGAGALVGTVIGENNSSFGVLYGIATLGSRDNNLNIGMGWGFAGGEMASNPTINISGMFRTGPKGYFITENYFIGTPNDFMVLISMGGRSIIRHIGIDYGAIVPIGGGVDTFVAIPWLGLTIPFGSRTP